MTKKHILSPIIASTAMLASDIQLAMGKHKNKTRGPCSICKKVSEDRVWIPKRGHVCPKCQSG